MINSAIGTQKMYLRGLRRPVSSPFGKGIPRPSDFLVEVMFKPGGKTYRFYHSRPFRVGEVAYIANSFHQPGKVQFARVLSCRRVTSKDQYSA